MFDKMSFEENRRRIVIPCYNSVFLRLLISTILILNMGLLSCSYENEDEVFQTFLEKNNGTEWLLRNDTLKVYIRINNNETNLIEQWYFREKPDCFDYNPNIFIPGDCPIKENSNECLTVMGDIILSDYESMTFSNEGSLLRVDITISEWEDDTVFFSISPISVDDLRICEPVDKINCLFFKTCH